MDNEEKYIPTDDANNPYSKEALNKIDPDTDEMGAEMERIEDDIEDRNDTAGGVGAWGGS